MKYIKKLEQIIQITDAERTALQPVADAYALSLIHI